MHQKKVLAIFNFARKKLHLLFFNVKKSRCYFGRKRYCKCFLTISPELGKLAEILYLMQVCKPCHHALVEAVEPFKLHLMSMSYIYEVFEHLLRLWMGYGFTFTLLPPQALSQSSESWMKLDIQPPPIYK